MTKVADIIFILDASGSMITMGDEPVQALNSFVKKQKELNDNSRFTFYTFNDTCEKVYDNVLLSEMKEYKDYSPSSVTALYDCIGTAIFDKMKTENKDNVTLVIVTDGLDNCSQTYSSSTIKKLISKQKEKHNWNVIYLGANQDSFAVGAKMGITTTGNYDQKLRGSLLRSVARLSDPIKLHRRKAMQGN